jgi:hypothetical protein
MNSSLTPVPDLVPAASAPLVSSGGVAVALPCPDSPLDALLDLMEVVEALCPQWPQRPLVIGTDYRI